VLQCIAVPCVTVCCRVLQRVAVCRNINVLGGVKANRAVLCRSGDVCVCVVCCSVLQRDAVCCSVL